MRVTTGMIYDTGLSSIQKQNSRVLDTMEQVATGRRILRPSDDPVASARALEVSQSKSVNSLYAANQGYANDALKLVDSKLDAANDIVTYVRTRAVESGNGSYSARDQAAVQNTGPNITAPTAGASRSISPGTTIRSVDSTVRSGASLASRIRSKTPPSIRATVE